MRFSDRVVTSVEPVPLGALTPDSSKGQAPAQNHAYLYASISGGTRSASCRATLARQAPDQVRRRAPDLDAGRI